MPVVGLVQSIDACGGLVWVLAGVKVVWRT